MDFKKASTIEKTLKNYNRFLDEHNALKEKQKDRKEQLDKIKNEKSKSPTSLKL